MSRQTFRMEDEYITMVRGDTLAFNVQFLDFDQELESAFFTVKGNTFEDTPLFQKSIDDGITLVDDDDTLIYAVRIAPDDTEDLDVGKYFYDLRIGANGDVFTVLRGVLELEQDFTREAENDY